MIALAQDLPIRWNKIRTLMNLKQVDACLISTNVNLLYTCGAIFSGYCYLPLEGDPILFVKRKDSTNQHALSIRKPEEIPTKLAELGRSMPQTLLLEADQVSYSEYNRLAAIFKNAICHNGTPLIREARSIKTAYEIELFKQSGAAHDRAYTQIPALYRAGMTDLDLSIEIERVMRKEGCLGVFRVFGQSMEIFMGSLLTGDNASAPSPFDFALGGAGIHPSQPVGLNGSLLKQGTTLMVDYGGNFTGYISDMTRVFSIGKVSESAYRAHQVALTIQDKVIEKIKPGAVCEELYELAIQIAKQAGYEDCFMGSAQQARFIGHGIGLEINESPVFAPRIKQLIKPNMVFALEPKIVLPTIGAVGVENSWVVTQTGVEKLTNLSEELISLT